jgi:hypothetical protein
MTLLPNGPLIASKHFPHSLSYLCASGEQNAAVNQETIAFLLRRAEACAVQRRSAGASAFTISKLQMEAAHVCVTRWLLLLYTALSLLSVCHACRS